MKLEHIATGSSNVEGVSYDTDTRVLVVAFHNGSRYTYTDVPKEKYFDLIAAPSIGSHLHRHIKPHHEATKMPDDAP